MLQGVGERIHVGEGSFLGIMVGCGIIGIIMFACKENATFFLRFAI